MQSSRLILTLIVAPVFFSASLARAVPVVITTADGQGADAFVQGSPTNTTNFGTAANLTLKNGNAADNFARKGYVRFDLSAPGNIDTINGAQLQMTVSINDLPSGSFTVDVFGLKDALAADGWDETMITWNNAPANVTNHGFNINATGADFLGQFTVASGDTPGTLKTFTDPDLLNFLAADTDGLATLLFRRSGTNASGGPNLSFATKENVTFGAPALLLDVSLVPEPASVAVWSLLSLVAAGIFVWRRRA